MGVDKLDTATCFFDFSSNDTLIGARYYFNHWRGNMGFDGKHVFDCNNCEERIVYSKAPKIKDVVSNIFMLNSIYEIKKLLPEFIKDSTITIKRLNDTIINSEDNYWF